ncbi:hypothetical protein LEP1GSC061_0299 [Leptospira wolffii serovar Khorat str. Khorat-H2]|nr:hypothetical protein LEP1GSC061_0299 [Leptospira wolffii serovar Khorat str. Khorat-H2]
MIGERTGQVLEAGYSGTRKMLQGDSYTARSKCPWTKTGMYIGFGGDIGLSAYILSFQFASAPHIIGGLFYLIGSIVKTQYPEIKECG